MEENLVISGEEVPVTNPEPSIKPNKVVFKFMKVGDNCERLNVRKLASMESDVIRILEKGCVVNINLEKSTDDFYYVASEIIDSEHKTPIHGYCKKDFLFE